MKILGSLFVCFLLSISVCHAALNGFTDNVIEVAFDQSGGDVASARNFANDKIVLESRLNRHVTRMTIDSLVRAGVSIHDLYPLGVSTVSQSSEIGNRFLVSGIDVLVGLSLKREAKVHMLVANAPDGLVNPKRVYRAKVKVLDHDTYVTSFDYQSRLVDFPLAKLLTVDDLVTKILPISKMEPRIAVNFIRMNDFLKSYEKSHPGANFRLILELQIGQEGTMDVILTSNTLDTYSAINPSLFGHWSKNYKEAQKLATAGGCAESVAASAAAE